MNRDKLLIKFVETFKALNGHGDALKRFILLENKYSEEFRCYHTLDHIAHCLEELETIDPSTLNINLMVMTVFLHDLVYIPPSGYSEELSADIARLWFPNEHGREIASGIMVTKDHSDGWLLEERYVSDIDLSILGSNPDKYVKYRDAIRQEYSYYGDEEFRDGRLKVLRSFLKKEFIFQTREFHDRYEERARINLQSEIDYLESRF